jgi:arylsulfatase A-like enzyme
MESPSLRIVYLPGNDLFTHKADQPPAGQEDAPLPLQVAYLESVTYKAIGDVLEAYDQLGVLDETYVLLIADHGHIPVLDDNRHGLNRTTGHSYTYAASCEIASSELSTVCRAWSAAVTSGV